MNRRRLMRLAAGAIGLLLLVLGAYGSLLVAEPADPWAAPPSRTLELALLGVGGALLWFSLRPPRWLR